MQPRDLPVSSFPLRSVLLPTLRLPPWEKKSEIIQGNKYYVKESDGEISAFRSKNWAWKLDILMEPALDGFRPRATARKKKKQKFHSAIAVFNDIWHACLTLKIAVDLVM